MMSPTEPPPASFSSNAGSIRILADRSQYKSCHVWVPDMDHRLPAIVLEDKYYSFFKTVDDLRQASSIVEKLTRRGDDALITQTNKGYTVWVEEPEGILECDDQPSPPTIASIATAPTIPIVEDRNQYRCCHIRVSDTEGRLPAILYGGKYYSLFKVLPDKRQALEIAAKLIHKREETVMTRMNKGYAVWVWESQVQSS